MVTCLRVVCDWAAWQHCPQGRLGSAQRSRLKVSSPYWGMEVGVGVGVSNSLVATAPCPMTPKWLHFTL